VRVAGEGILGLTAPVLQAGARSVVATRWRIGDREALGIIRPFYDALAAGLPVGDALQAAKLAALRRGAPARAWVTFTAVGDPLVRVPLHRPRTPWQAWAAGLAGVVVLLGAVGARAARGRSAAAGRLPEGVRQPHDLMAHRDRPE
jgi:hypothetical protein